MCWNELHKKHYLLIYQMIHETGYKQQIDGFGETYGANK